MKLNESILKSIEDVHGSSFYLLDAEQFQSNYQRLANAFCKEYENATIAYSYKTNYIPRFCQIVQDLCGYAEVVSSMEMMLAIKLGVPPNKIFFNGPYKEHKYVEDLLIAGGTVNLDSYEELERVLQSAQKHNGAPFRIGLRCNFDSGDGQISRFGFDVKDQSFQNVLNLIQSHHKVRLVGLHCHFASRNIESWRNRTSGMIQVIQRYLLHNINQLEHISLGGGLYGQMPVELKSQFDTTIPSFEEYAEASAKQLNRFFSANLKTKKPILIIEPGTALVASAMKYVCKVNSIKNIRGQTIVGVSGSAYNINPNPNRKNFPIECVLSSDTKIRQKLTEASFGGYTCIEGDYLYKGFNGELGVGDYVVFSEIGAYSVVMKPPFILPNVAIIEVSKDLANWTLIKSGENFGDLFRLFNPPVIF